MKFLSSFLPWFVVSLAALYLIVAMRPPSNPPEEMQIAEAGRLVVVDGGRHKPLDTYVRTQLMILSNRQDYTDPSDQTQPAIRWLLDTMAMGLSMHYDQTMHSIRVSDPELREFFELGPQEGNLYALREIVEKPKFKKELQRVVEQVDPAKRTMLDRKVLALAMQMARRAERVRASQAIQANLDKRQTERVAIFRIENDQLLQTLGLTRRKGLRYSWSEIIGAKGYKPFAENAQKLENDQRLGKRSENDWDLVEGKTMELSRHLQTYGRAAFLMGVLLVPPPANAPDQDWMELAPALAQGDLGGADNPSAAALENLLSAYGTGDVEGFNKGLVAYRGMLEERYPSASWYARLETFFNDFAPFYQCMALYVLVILLVLLSWILFSFDWMAPLNRAAFWLLGFTFLVHSLALVARMIIQGRPPVTNLYSSAIFIGWGAVALGLVLECIYRIGIGSLVGAAIGFLTTFISHHLATSGDTLEMMQAVLDTNFWLATHVVCVTMGYTATFVAGFLAIIYVLGGLLTPWLNRNLSPSTLGGAKPSLDRPLGKTLIQMIYGVVCFATLLSFVGTVLGGVWADQSWGRFWGWDPKENGALLIVAMNALILHARWAGMIKDRGMAVLAMVGNMVTLWSWFGTNQLGIGLHAYGFNKTLVEVCRYGWITQGLLIGAALLPLRFWWSFRPGSKPSSTPNRAARGRKPSAQVPAVTR